MRHPLALLYVQTTSETVSTTDQNAPTGVVTDLSTCVVKTMENVNTKVSLSEYQDPNGDRIGYLYGATQVRSRQGEYQLVMYQLWY